MYDANIIAVSLFFAKRNRGSDGWDARGDDDKVLFRTVGHHLVKPKSRGTPLGEHTLPICLTLQYQLDMINICEIRDG